MVPTSSRASDGASGFERGEVRSCGVCKTRDKVKTEGVTDPAHDQRIVVGYKIRSSLPASEGIDP